MRRPLSLAAPLFFVLASCGTPPPVAAPPAPTAAPETSAAPGSAAAPEASAEPAASAAPVATAEAPGSEAATLARELAKAGGRRIGYSASKKAFAHPVERHVPNGGFSLDIQFTGEDGSPRDAMRVCQVGECEDRLDEMLKGFLPKLTERIERDGFTTIRAIGWPGGGDELEVSSLGAKLHYDKGRLTRVITGKPGVALTKLGGPRFDNAPEAVFVVPGGKLLAVFAKPSGDAKGLLQELHVFKLP
ncbi:MAG: hypothetical protein ABJE95_11845 [Byssovorax sp.]